MSTGPESLAVAFLLGGVLGAGYMAALWGAVRGLARSRHPVAWLLGGAVVRVGLLLGFFYLIMDGQWERLLACVAGFVVVRVAVTRWASTGAAPKTLT